MPCGHRHAPVGHGGTRAYAAALAVNPCLAAVNLLDAINQETPEMSPGGLGSTPEKCYKILAFQGVGQMQHTSRTIYAKVAEVIVEETKSLDAEGRPLGYAAAIYVRVRGRSERHFIRKTRLPETAEILAAAIRQRGLRALGTPAA